ncbi:lycopene cyclase domain-containing protein [Actinosynnema sp. NPDC023587]|uniref:lycopene cyclase domain-containing protein n=1 Tax=Actinosynnema sp. NPDC023587 TaxID=3154695 RepID=UPI0033D9188D
MPEYLVTAVVSVVLVVAVELFAWRTGLFRKPAYWLALAVVLAFQIPVDGWLTKLTAPVVRYADWTISGLRIPWDIPVEDFLFAFSMVTLTLLLWERRKEAVR